MACAWTAWGQSPALRLTGLVHGSIGGAPKAVELYASEDIADLSLYSLGTANNGSGSPGPEWTFPAVPASAGQLIYVSKESPVFTEFFGQSPDFVDDGAACNFNGDDAVELMLDGVVIDAYGEPDVDGTGTPWDYAFGWAYRGCAEPEGAGFAVGDWSVAAGAMNGIATNDAAANPFPIGDFLVACAPVVDGCTEPHADNFNPAANTDDGSCTYAAYFAASGCTYAGAANFDPAALHDDGSCTFDLANPCPADLNGNGTVDVGDLLNLLGTFGEPCTPPELTTTGTGVFDSGIVPVHYYVPAGLQPDAEVVMVFHGNNRNAADYRDAWMDRANELGLVVLAPEFNATDFPGSEAYMQGGMVNAAGVEQPVETWTFGLVDPLINACQTWLNSTDPAIDLWGHSAGGQFVHRFMLFLGSDLVDRAVAANSGWYTTPDPTITYPYGMLNAPTGGIDFVTATSGQLVISLGTADTLYSGPIHTPEADLQGLNRYERGLHFIDVAEGMGGLWNWSWFEVPGVGHDGVGMAEAAAGFLFGP